MSAGRREILMVVAQRRGISVDRAEAAAVQLLLLIDDEQQDGTTFILRNRKATADGVRVSDRRFELDRLVDGALEREH